MVGGEQLAEGQGDGDGLAVAGERLGLAPPAPTGPRATQSRATAAAVWLLPVPGGPDTAVTDVDRARSTTSLWRAFSTRVGATGDRRPVGVARPVRGDPTTVPLGPADGAPVAEPGRPGPGSGRHRVVEAIGPWDLSPLGPPEGKVPSQAMRVGPVPDTSSSVRRWSGARSASTRSAAAVLRARRSPSWCTPRLLHRPILRRGAPVRCASPGGNLPVASVGARSPAGRVRPTTDTGELEGHRAERTAGHQPCRRPAT